MKVNLADITVLSRLLNRKKKTGGPGLQMDLGAVLCEILTWANKFVPSESGSILLDDPVLKWNSENEGRLYFTACFGKGSKSLVGTFLMEDYGIAGETYRAGKPYISRDVRKDDKFFPAIDRKIHHTTRSIICAPMVIGGSKIGVIELINRKGRMNYDSADLAMLNIFAGYTATLIHNAIIGRRFEELSQKDTLTDLYNDRYFFQALEHEVGRSVKEGKETSVVFFDLDRFKEMNDNHGHLAGSTVLKEVADIVREVFHSSGAVPARYGGDEFAVILPECGSAEATGYAEALRSHVEDHTFLKRKGGGKKGHCNIRGLITCSIGVASLSGKKVRKGKLSVLAEALLKAADSAMYLAKERGKNRVCVS